jgi:hypothetical protein
VASGRFLNMAAGAKAAVTADEMTRVIRRAVEDKPGEVRSQHKEGDPECHLGHPIHLKTSIGLTCIRHAMPGGPFMRTDESM